MNEIKYVKAYAIYAILGLLLGAIVGAIQGGILGFILGMAQVKLNVIPIITGITGFICGTFVSFFIFRWSIRKYILPQVSIVETDEINCEQTPA